MRPLPPGTSLRPILFKLLHFRDRDSILQAARDKRDLEFARQKVSLDPDFSTEVQKKRLQFFDIIRRRRLRNVNIPYSMQYPAKLRVVALESTPFFGTPSEALSWLDKNEKPGESHCYI